MASLFKNIRIHQIFGANTDVGKTLLTAAVVLGSALRGRNVQYLKPVSTGPLSDADDEFIKHHTSEFTRLVKQTCLYRFGEPISPHIAARIDTSSDVSDPDLISSVSSFLGKLGTSGSKIDVYIETAGGVHSPVPSGTSQLDCYRPLLLPTVLVGDSRLGGISSTIASYESLSIRGYTVDAVLIFKEDYYRNWEYLIKYFGEKDVPLFAIPPPPVKHADQRTNFVSTSDYYRSVVRTDLLSKLQDTLETAHVTRIAELDSMAARTLESVWWPFVQHGLVRHKQDVTVIDSAYNDFFNVYNSKMEQATKDMNVLSRKFDGSASWWTQTFGHGEPRLALAAARAAGRYGHVMFPQATHRPALTLAERMLQGPGRNWASRVFFSDDGSTAMEVALKMALRTYCKSAGRNLHKEEKKHLSILGLKGSYHGDTIGAMNACDATDGVYTCEWHSAKGYWFDPPSVSIRNGQTMVTLPSVIAKMIGRDQITVESLQWVYDVENRLQSELSQTYRAYIRKTIRKLQEAGSPHLASLVLEPIVMGAGGMIFVDPLFQRILVESARDPELFGEYSSADWLGLPIVYDEVFVGLYRLGWESCIPVLGVNPDISVYAKTLTGGLVPLALTLASERVFNSFLGDEKAQALLHGHSYTAHAVGCEVANESLCMMQELSGSSQWDESRTRWITPETTGRKARNTNSLVPWSLWDPNFVRSLSGMDSVSEVMTLGSVLSIKLEDNQGGGYVSHAARDKLQSIQNETMDEHRDNDCTRFGVHFRTLGNVAYFMSSLNTPESVLRIVERKVQSALSK